MSREFGWIETRGYAHMVMMNVAEALAYEDDLDDGPSHKITKEVGLFLEKYIQPMVHRVCSEEAGDASHDIMRWMILLDGVLVGVDKLRDKIEEIEISDSIFIEDRGE